MKKITLMLFAIFALSWHANAQVLTEGFDTAGLPTGWTETQLSGTPNWVSGAANNQNSTVQPRTGTGMAYFYSGNYNGDSARLESPPLDLTALTSPLLTFYYTQLDWGGDQDVLSIYYKDFAAGTWTLLQEFSASVGTWTEVNILLPSSSDAYYIGFQGVSGWGRGITVDDVLVGEAPSCLAPGSLGVNPTSTTTTTLSWVPAGSETDFTYEYGATGYTQGTGAIASGSVSATNVGIMDLTPNTDYDFYVQANCGLDGDSQFSGPFTWTQPDAGDACGAAIAATLEADCGVATPITLDFTGASSNISTSCDTFNNYGKWVTVTTDASGVLVVNASAAVDLAIYDMCGGTDIECYGGGVAPATTANLSPNTQYYLYFWQEGTASTAMVDVCFTPNAAPAPDCASNPMPIDGAVEVPNGTVTLSWDAPATGPTPTDYNLYAGSLADGSDLALVGNFATTTADVTVNGFDTTIYWQVVPVNTGTEASGCPIWSLTTVSPPQGALCDNPIVISGFPSTTSGDTNGFGDDYGSTDEICSNSSYLTGDDIVYSYSPSVDQTVNFTLSGTGTWTGIFVYEGCAPFTTCVASDTNSAGNPSADNVSLIGGTTYYIVISTWPTPQSTVFTLDILTPPPPNNDCTGAIPLTFSSAPADDIIVDDTGATDSGTTSSCDSGGADLWYSFTASATAEAYFNTTAAHLSVWDACGGAEVACNPGNNVPVSGLVDGNTYLVRVHGGTTRATFTLRMSDFSLSTDDLAFTGFKYFPNPTTGILSLRAQDNIQAVSVYNMIGQEVLRATPNTLTDELDMSGLNTGAYFLKVRINDAEKNFRIIKE